VLSFGSGKRRYDFDVNEKQACNCNHACGDAHGVHFENLSMIKLTLEREDMLKDEGEATLSVETTLADMRRSQLRSNKKAECSEAFLTRLSNSSLSKMRRQASWICKRSTLHIIGVSIEITAWRLTIWQMAAQGQALWLAE
jgi:hypothetical protein